MNLLSFDDQFLSFATQSELEVFAFEDRVRHLLLVRLGQQQGQRAGDESAQAEGDQRRVRVVGVKEDHPR